MNFYTYPQFLMLIWHEFRPLWICIALLFVALKCVNVDWLLDRLFDYKEESK